MNNVVKKVLYAEDAILQRLDEMARKITEDYRGKEFTVVAIMNGSVIFLADLLRRIPIPLLIDGLSISSYAGTESTGVITFRQTTLPDLRGRHVIILDDVLDTGATLRAVHDRFAQESKALSLKTCVLLKKNRAVPPSIEADYIGFEIPDEYVIGYGFDYQGYYRNLPYIGVLKEEVYR